MAKFNLPNEYDGVELSDKQLEPFSALLERERMIILNGAIRVGKSLIASSMLAIFIQDGAARGKYYEYACQAYTYDNAWKNLTRRVAMYLYYELGFTDIQIVGETIVHSLFRVYTHGANNTRASGTIQGSTYRGVLTDEAAIIDSKALEMARTRTETFKDGTVIHTTNPEGGKNHPYYKRYIKNKHSKVITFKMTDSPLFTQKKVEKFKEIYSPSMYEQKVLGKWTAAEGSVYIQQPKIVNKTPKEFKYLRFGIDEGRTDGTVCHAIGITDNDEYYVIKTYYHKNGNQQKTYFQIAEEISEFIKYVSNQYKAITEVYGDTTPGVTIQYLQNDLTIPKHISIEYAEKNKIQNRIDMTVALIGLGKLFIYEDCEELIGAFENAVYKNDVRLDNGTSDIDSLDAFEYAIEVDMDYINDVLIWKEDKIRSEYEWLW